METLVQIESGDRKLLQGIDASMRLAVERGGAWIACKPGCTQCCIGPFAITALDALRLQSGLRRLQTEDPARAEDVKRRAREYIRDLAGEYPGNIETGELFDEDALPESMDDVPCPALDSQTGLCDLYDHRPITCRTFGPVTRVASEAFAACELCYEGATDEEIAACVVEIDPEGMEPQLLDKLAQEQRLYTTIVAFALGRFVGD